MLSRTAPRKDDMCRSRRIAGAGDGVTGRMRFPSLTPADHLTLLRLLALPVLWVLAAQEQSFYLGVGVALAGFTDILDGPVARLTGQSSRFGSQLDSVADILLMSSILLWIGWLHPDFFRDNAVPLLVWAAVGIAAVVATLVRFGRLGDLHLYSAKAAGVVSYLFAVWLFLTGGYSPLFFGIAAVLAILAAAETLLVALTRERLKGRIRSILEKEG